MKTMKTIKISGGSLPSDFVVNVPTTIDYAGSSESQRKAWMDATVTIRLQRAWKTLGVDALEQMQTNGVTILAIDAGKKYESRETQIARRAVAMGGNEELAVLATDNPDDYLELMAKVKIKPNTNE